MTPGRASPDAQTNISTRTPTSPPKAASSSASDDATKRPAPLRHANHTGTASCGSADQDIESGQPAQQRAFCPFGQCARAESADQWDGFSRDHFVAGLVSGMLFSFASFALRCLPVGKGPSFHNGNIVGIIFNTVLLAILLFAGVIPLPTRHEAEAPKHLLSLG